MFPRNKSSLELNGTVRADESASVIRQKKVIDYSGTAEPVLPISEASMVQLKPGPAPTNLTIFSSKKISVLGMQHHTSSVGVIILKPDHFGFMWWDGNEDCRINGELARRTVIYSQGEQDGFHAAGGTRKTMGFAVRRSDLIHTFAALRGIGPEEVALKHATFELSPSAAIRFRNGVNVLLKNTIERTSKGASSEVSADPAESFYGLLVEARLSSRSERTRNHRAQQPEQIVRKAEERFFASQGTPVSLADLCNATGVSQATLYRAFHHVCGEPPLSYFHKRRLTYARRALINSHAYRGAVKHAALTCGMTEFGRFSVEYRNLFGELPSATLNKHPPT